MLWADVNGRRELAAPGARGTCPSCGGDVIAKCGQIVRHHWAHAKNDCPFSTEPETDWHRDWKGLFPAEMQEVVIGNRRADLQTPWGVVELQHSAISPKELQSREQDYGKRMLWVVDLTDANLQLWCDGAISWLWRRKAYDFSWRPRVYDIRFNPSKPSDHPGLIYCEASDRKRKRLRGTALSQAEFVRRCLQPADPNWYLDREAETEALKELDRESGGTKLIPPPGGGGTKFLVTPFTLNGHLLFEAVTYWPNRRNQHRFWTYENGEAVYHYEQLVLKVKRHNAPCKWINMDSGAYYGDAVPWAKDNLALFETWRKFQ